MYIKKQQDLRLQTELMDSVAGVARVPPAPGVVVAPLGAAVLAASIVAAGAAAGKAGKESGLAPPERSPRLALRLLDPEPE